MGAFAIILGFTGALLSVDCFDSKGSPGVWKRISINDGFEVLKELRPVGFIIWENVQLNTYLGRTGLKNSTYLFPTSIHVQSNGKIVYRDLDRSKWPAVVEILEVKYYTSHVVEVLKTPRECLSWIPIPEDANSADIDIARFVQSSDAHTIPICRVWVEKEGIYVGHLHPDSHKCNFYTTAGSRLSAQGRDVEILVYNELSKVLPQCKI